MRLTQADRLWSAAFAGAVWAGAAHAQFEPDLQAITDVLIPDRTIISLGAGPRYSPDYLGSNDYDFDFDPNIRVRLRYATIDEGGLAVDLTPDLDIDIGPFVRIAGGRSEDANEILEGLGRVGRALEVGGFVGVRMPEPGFAARARFRSDVVNGHGGELVDIQVSQRLLRAGDFSTATSFRVTWADDDYTDSFFGITPEQSLASGVLPEFNPGAGFRDVRLALTARYEITEKWAIDSFTTYSRLVGDTADSPLVDDFGTPNQFIVGLRLSRSFRFEIPGQ